MIRAATRIAAVAVTALGLASLAGPVRAATTPGGASLVLGMDDGTLFEQSPPATQALWLSRARALGSTNVRLLASWNGIAPAQRPRDFDAANPGDPAYDWTTLDANVRAAAASGQSVLLQVFAAPTWAAGPDRPAGVDPAIWLPNAADFGAFAHAVALRYSGHYPDPLHPGRTLPRVRYFQAWNEPNLPSFLMPQWQRAPNGAWTAVSPSIYRSMLNAFYAAVKSAQPGSVVVGAATGPYGDPPATGQGRMAPITFLDGLFCLTAGLRPQRCPDPPHLDVLDHHPYAIAPTVPAALPNDVSVPDLGKIWRVLDAARRWHRVLPDTPKQLWVTEIDWTSGHPDTPALQARYLSLGFYEFWRQGVSRVYWYELRDPPEPPGSYRDAGLYYYDGIPKPAAAAYRFPFVALAAPHRRRTLWGRAPAPGGVTIQALVRGRWRRLFSLRTTSGGIFFAVRPVAPKLELRAVSHGVASVPWVRS